MGLSHVIAGFFLAMVLVVVFASFAYGMLNASTSSYIGLMELRRNIVLDANTRIRIADFTTLSPNSFTISIENDGNAKVLLDDTMDVIVDYVDDSGSRWTKRLEYNTTTDGWAVQDIQGDYIDPGILNPEEVATLLVSLSTNLNNGTLTVVVCAKYGYPSQLSSRVET